VIRVPSVTVLRWGHRPRDMRLTTHVALTARALGAAGMILADMEDEGLRKTIDKVVDTWGGAFFLHMGMPWREAVFRWKASGGAIVHLTAYGENIQTSDVLQRIQATEKDVLVIVGSQKVPAAFFSEETADFNVAIGNQPHSECTSLAVFLDRFFEGTPLAREFKEAARQIVPQAHGKKVLRRSKA
jgi:tRNA (cytidine56-2'-O)-methyltransferase